MGKGQRPPGLHVGWIKSSPGFVAGGPWAASAAAGPASVDATPPVITGLPSLTVTRFSSGSKELADSVRNQDAPNSGRSGVHLAGAAI